MFWARISGHIMMWVHGLVSDDEPPPLVYYYYNIERGIRMSPLTRSTLTIPLPAEPEGSEFALHNSVPNSETAQTNEGSSEYNSEYRYECYHCAAYSHEKWTCEDCGCDDTHIIEMRCLPDGDVITRYYIECYECEAVSPFIPEARTEERLHTAQVIHSSNVRRRSTPSGSQPQRTPRLQATLVAEVEINGVKAFTLFDSGSTTNSITAEFAFATKAKQITLEDQVILQLGCVGSRSKISHGTKVPINLCGIQDQIYLDLVNIDQYDCIIGTPFMNTYGVCLDFGKCTIRMNGQKINVLSFEEERQYVDKKKLGRSRGPRPPPRETAPIPIRRTSPPNPPTSA